MMVGHAHRCEVGKLSWHLYPVCQRFAQACARVSTHIHNVVEPPVAQSRETASLVLLHVIAASVFFPFGPDCNDCHELGCV